MEAVSKKKEIKRVMTAAKEKENKDIVERELVEMGMVYSRSKKTAKQCKRDRRDIVGTLCIHKKCQFKDSFER